MSISFTAEDARKLSNQNSIDYTLKYINNHIIPKIKNEAQLGLFHYEDQLDAIDSDLSKLYPKVDTVNDIHYDVLINNLKKMDFNSSYTSYTDGQINYLTKSW